MSKDGITTSTSTGSSTGSSSRSSSNDASACSWSLSIKPVGAEHSSATTNGTGLPSKDFTIEVSPDDDLTSLYEQIEGVTGLKASQQRLIYRGRLIGRNTYGNDNNNNNEGDTKKKQRQRDDFNNNGVVGVGCADTDGQELKIKDIHGLSDGQTIHLVKKRDQPPEEEGEERSGDVRQQPATPGGSGGAGAGDGSSDSGEAELFGTSSAAPLLAALLGLGDDDRGGGTESGTGTGSGRRWRSSRTASASRRRIHHRLTSEDLEVPDPGSMESVRQGMMTLHTLLPHAQAVSTASRSGQTRSPLLPVEANRRWYVGQWIDCLDTVNQWLEATITEIVAPDDILPPRTHPLMRVVRRAPRTSSSSSPDPIVTATDLEGRRMLLLEPCEEFDSESEGGELAGFKRRDNSNNDDVQLLLVHYNGWPHRWDEWIRSDSDRIRPFRVRTRHPNSSSHASPTPQSVYSESPSTLIRSRDEAADRVALLPELSRVMTAVNELLSAATLGMATHAHAAQTAHTAHASSFPTRGNNNTGGEVEDAANLPWIHRSSSGSSSNDGGGGGMAVCSTSAESDVPPSSSTIISPPACLLRTELESLAPLLDRLGRTLIDAAPQVSALSRSLDPLSGDQPPSADEMEQAQTELQEHSTSLGGLLSLLGRERRRQSSTSNNVVVPAGDTSSVQESVQSGTTRSDDTTTVVVVDPDLSDFAYGVVNTTRGEVRRGPRSRGGSSDDAAGIFGAYLAAASLGSLAANNNNDEDEDDGNLQGLGRLLRERGSGGGGIDIHIHAVVTAPGIPSGGFGLATLTGGGGGTGMALGGTGTNRMAANNNDTVGGLFSTSRSLGRHSQSPSRAATTTRPSPAVAAQDDDDEGIFSELYSENPDPIDPSRSPSSPSSSSEPNNNNHAIPHVGVVDHGPTTSEIPAPGHQHPPPQSPSSRVTTTTTSPSLASSNANAGRSGSWRQGGGVERSMSNSSSRHRGGGGGGGGGGVFGRFFRRNASTDGE